MLLLQKCCTQYASKFGKLSSSHRTGKGQFSFQSQKECSNFCTIALISHASKVMLKSLQARLQQYIKFKLDLERAEEPEIILPTSVRASKKQESFRKTSTTALLTTAKCGPLCVDHNKLWKILQEMGIPDHLTCLLRNLYQVKKQRLELDMEQRTGSKLEKEYVKAVYCQPAYLTYMQSTLWEIISGGKGFHTESRKGKK